MEIWDWIKRKWRELVVVKSIIWTTIIWIFKQEKNIDLTNYLISINVRWKTIIIKTNKPIINSQLLLFDDKIKEESKKKITKIWLKFDYLEVKYI